MNSKKISQLIDTDLTLEQLESDLWGDAPEGVTRLVTKCHELRRKKIRNFETEEFRLLIGQNIGLQFLIPLVIQVLCRDAFVQGDFYEGDLLKSVLESKREYWRDHKDLKMEVIEIFERNKDRLQKLDASSEIKGALIEAYDKFIQN